MCVNVACLLSLLVTFFLMLVYLFDLVGLFFFFFSGRRRDTICALVTGVQTCALPISVIDPPPSPSPVFLVACVAAKLDRPAPARDLYASPWFQKARAYVERQGGAWFILSAKHGLIAPETVIAPYDETL